MQLNKNVTKIKKVENISRTKRIVHKFSFKSLFLLGLKFHDRIFSIITPLDKLKVVTPKEH